MYINTQQASELIGYSIHAIRDKARNKEIPCHRIGRKWLFDPAELEKFVTQGEPRDRLTI